VVVTVVGTIITAIDRVVRFLGGVGNRISAVTRGMWDGIWQAFRGAINSIIRGWNNLSFSVPSFNLGPLGNFGGQTIGTPNVQYLHTGGIVPGVPGSNVAAILQAGERVVPRTEARGGGITIIVQGHIYGISGVDELSDRVALRLRMNGTTV
jgi:hypothetical protein